MVKFINISLCCLWLPLLMAIACCTCPAQTRLCGVAGMKDDRIIFPRDDGKHSEDAAWFKYENNNSSSSSSSNSSSSNSNSNSTVSSSGNNSSMVSIGSTTPLITLATNYSSAQLEGLPFANTTLEPSELAMNDTEDATTIIPIVQNRIIFDTEPKCGKNFTYVRKACRRRA